jgi:hypothetical protein
MTPLHTLFCPTLERKNQKEHEKKLINFLFSQHKEQFPKLDIKLQDFVMKKRRGKWGMEQK